jgi:hypothetical protein
VKKAAVPLIAALPNLRILDITEEYQGWVTKKTLYILLSQAAAGGRLTINLRTCHVSACGYKDAARASGTGVGSSPPPSLPTLLSLCMWGDSHVVYSWHVTTALEPG